MMTSAEKINGKEVWAKKKPGNMEDNVSTLVARIILELEVGIQSGDMVGAALAEALNTFRRLVPIAGCFDGKRAGLALEFVSWMENNHCYEIARLEQSKCKFFGAAPGCFL